MTTNPTRPVPVSPTPVDPRDVLMRTFAVAETVVAGLADVPTSITIDEYNGSYRVQIYFHRAPEQVARFAAGHCAEVSVNEAYNDGTSTYTSAEVLVDGVSVCGWSLLRHEERTA